MHRFSTATIVALSVAVLTVLTVAAASASTQKLDFGDAPDGARAYYGGTKTGGLYPSTEESDGARTTTTSEVWLGTGVSKEKASLQVDQDTFDDGASLRMTSCATSTAIFYVHVENPGETSGTAYLNLYADWDKDGEWGGSDECAAEWAVRNFPVTLSDQSTAVEVYMPAFTAGKKINNLWWRAMVTVDQRVTNENGTGLYASGEVEDYGPAVSGKRKKYGVQCIPSPLTIEHGNKGMMTIVERPGTTPFSSIGFPNSIDPNGDGVINGKMRKLEIVGADRVRVTSKKRHNVDLIERRSTPVSVRYADGERIIETCLYNIVHEPITGVSQEDHTYTRTEFSPSGFTVSRGATSVVSVDIIPQETIATEMLSMQISGFQVPFGGQHPALPDPADIDLNINGQGWPADWTCDYDSSSRVKTCQGSSTLMSDASSFDLFFNEPIDDLDSFHMLLIIPEGNMALDMPPGTEDASGTEHPTAEQPVPEQPADEPQPQETLPEENTEHEKVPQNDPALSDPFLNDPYSTY